MRLRHLGLAAGLLAVLALGGVGGYLLLHPAAVKPTPSVPAKPAQAPKPPVGAPASAAITPADNAASTTPPKKDFDNSSPVKSKTQSVCTGLTCAIANLSHPNLVLFAIGFVPFLFGMAAGLGLGALLWGRTKKVTADADAKVGERLASAATSTPSDKPQSTEGTAQESFVTDSDWLMQPRPAESDAPAETAEPSAPAVPAPAPEPPQQVVEPEPAEPIAAPEPPQPAYAPDDVVQVVDELMAATGIGRNDVEEVLASLSTAVDGEAALLAVINGLRAATVKKDARPVTWLNHTAQLAQLVTACGYSEQRAVLLVPGFNTDYDMATMHDYAMSSTGSRSKVAKLIAPGLKLDGRVMVKASIESM